MGSRARSSKVQLQYMIVLTDRNDADRRKSQRCYSATDSESHDTDRIVSHFGIEWTFASKRTRLTPIPFPLIMAT